MVHSRKLSVLEKVGYSLGDLAANLVFQTLVTYLAYFYTDIYGLKAEHASALIFVVGLVAAFAFNPSLALLPTGPFRVGVSSDPGYYGLLFHLE